MNMRNESGLKSLFLQLTLVACALAPLAARAYDTDIFTASNNNGAANVLIILDNTSNWSRNDEKFPDGNGGTITQGQAEGAAIQKAMSRS